MPATEELKQSPPDAYATWTMADESEVMAPIFLGRIRFPEFDEDIATLAAECEREILFVMATHHIRAWPLCG
jgi:3-hydroxy-3-methylglutaryl CoA synthase